MTYPLIHGRMRFSLTHNAGSCCGFKSRSRLHGDVVWVKARAEANVAAILEGDIQLMGKEAKVADLLDSAW